MEAYFNPIQFYLAQFNSIGEVFPAAAGGFFSAKCRSWDFVICVRLGEVFLAAAGAFLDPKMSSPPVRVQDFMKSGTYAYLTSGLRSPLCGQTISSYQRLFCAAPPSPPDLLLLRS